MKPRHRSFSGIAIALVGLPIFLGLMACLPVPIGDPEKSRIDPDLSGVWIVPDEDGERASVVLLEPFDKRTWLWTSYEVRADDAECDLDDPDNESANDAYDRFVTAVEHHGSDCFQARGFQMYKTWQTKLGKHYFMTHEIKGSYADENEFFFGVWFGYRLDKQDANNFSLRLIDVEFDGFEDIDGFDGEAGELALNDPKKHRRLRRDFEKVIRRNADDDALYGDDPMPLIRVRPDDVEAVLETIEDAAPNPDL